MNIKHKREKRKLKPTKHRFTLGAGTVFHSRTWKKKENKPRLLASSPNLILVISDYNNILMVDPGAIIPEPQKETGQARELNSTLIVD